MNHQYHKISEQSTRDAEFSSDSYTKILEHIVGEKISRITLKRTQYINKINSYNNGSIFRLSENGSHVFITEMEFVFLEISLSSSALFPTVLTNWVTITINAGCFTATIPPSLPILPPSHRQCYKDGNLESN